MGRRKGNKVDKQSKQISAKTMIDSSDNFKQSYQYYILKQKYSIPFLKNIENDQAKINVFYDIVLPSLATQKIIPDIGLFPRWICLFSQCLVEKKSFSCKQIFLRHTIDKHGTYLPGAGLFLSPNSNTVRLKGFNCETCGTCFNRKDNHDQHLKSLIHFKNLIVAEKMAVDSEVEKKTYSIES